MRPDRVHSVLFQFYKTFENVNYLQYRKQISGFLEPVIVPGWRALGVLITKGHEEIF